MNIEIAAEDALALVQNLLPILEFSVTTGVPASGASVATPILIKLSHELGSKGVIDEPTQVAQLQRFQKVLDFTGQEKPSESPPSSPEAP